MSNETHQEIAREAAEQLYPNVKLPKRSHAESVILAAIEKATKHLQSDLDDARNEATKMLKERNEALLKLYPEPVAQQQRSEPIQIGGRGRCAQCGEYYDMADIHQCQQPPAADAFKCEKCGSALGWCEPRICDKCRDQPPATDDKQWNERSELEPNPWILIRDGPEVILDTVGKIFRFPLSDGPTLRGVIKLHEQQLAAALTVKEGK
jgi:hypothetical protein